MGDVADVVNDAVDRAVGRCALVPPRSINPNKGFYLRRRPYIDDFVRSGDVIVAMLTDFAGLSSDDRVLDVGCGIGRVARPLTKVLTKGSYCGLDIVPDAIAWCTDAYSNQPTFSFRHLDLSYGRIRRTGSEPETVEFPFDRASFDLAFSISLFTHLTPAAVAQNLREMRRVLAPGGRCFNTFLVIDDHASAAIEDGSASHTFGAHFNGFRAYSASFVENYVGINETEIRRLHAEAGLTIEEPILFGSWTGRSTNRHFYQDAVVARVE